MASLLIAQREIELELELEELDSPECSWRLGAQKGLGNSETTEGSGYAGAPESFGMLWALGEPGKTAELRAPGKSASREEPGALGDWARFKGLGLHGNLAVLAELESQEYLAEAAYLAKLPKRRNGKPARRMSLYYYLTEAGWDAGCPCAEPSFHDEPECRRPVMRAFGRVRENGSSATTSATATEMASVTATASATEMEMASVTSAAMAAPGFGRASYGVRVAKIEDGQLEDKTIDNVTHDRKLAQDIIKLLADNSVTPISLRDVLEDIVGAM
jgi:hypothetical protein